MKCKDARLLAIRQVDDELSAENRKLLDEHLAACEACRDFDAEEREAAERAEAAGEELRVGTPSLETAVLRDLAKQPTSRRAPRDRLLIAATLAAAAVVAVIVTTASRDDETVRSPGGTARTFTFDAIFGPAPTRLDAVSYAAEPGSYRIKTDELISIRTSLGTVQLEPGTFMIVVKAASLSIKVEKGAASFDNGGGAPQIVVPGPTRFFFRVAPGFQLKVQEEKKANATAATMRVTGVVVDKDGGPVAGARIWVGRDFKNSGGEFVLATETDGRFVVDKVAGTAFVGARAAGFAPSDLRHIRAVDKTEVDLRIPLIRLGGKISGIVKDSEGNPVSGARVLVGGALRSEPGQANSEEGYRLWAAPPLVLSTGKDGRFEGLGLHAEWQPLRVRATGFAPWAVNVRIPPKGEWTQTVALDAGSVVTGVVKDELGRPIPGVAISCVQSMNMWFAEPPEVKTDTKGRFTLENTPLGRVALKAASDNHGQKNTWIVMRSDGANTWSPILRKGLAIRGLVEFDDGTPAAGFRLFCAPARLSGGEKPVYATTDADGRFDIGNRGRRSYRMRLWHPGKLAYRLAPTMVFDLNPGTDSHRLVVPKQAPEPSHLTGVVVDSEGVAVNAARVRAWIPTMPGWGRVDTNTDIDGAFRLGPVTAQPHQVEVHVDGKPTLHLGPFDLEAGKTLDLKKLRFPEPSFVECEVEFPSEYPQSQWKLWLYDAKRTAHQEMSRNREGVFVSESVAPGVYRIIPMGFTGYFREISVEEGQRTFASFSLPPRVVVTFQFDYPGGDSAQELHFEVSRTTAPVRWEQTLANLTESSSATLVPARYALKASDDRGRKGSVVFDVDPDVKKQTIRIRVE